MRQPAIILCVLGGLCLTNLTGGCSGKGAGTPPVPSVPPEYAYPRLALKTADSLVAVHPLLMVNPNAVVTHEKTGDSISTAITVDYPGNGVTIYYTIRPVSDNEMAEAVENRITRMSLNRGNTPCEILYTVRGSDMEGMIQIATSQSTTPVQLLAVGGGHLVSGAAYLKESAGALNYDSIYPVIEMIRHDMERAIPSVSFSRQ